MVLVNPYTVFQQETSYCHFGYEYRKRTVFITTLLRFNPPLPCPDCPCRQWRLSQRHKQNMIECGFVARNSIPPPLTCQIIDAWIHRTQWAEHRIFLDVFSGFGSVSEVVKSRYPQIDIFCNDIVNRDHTNIQLDVSSTRDVLMVLLRFALAMIRRGRKRVDVYTEASNSDTLDMATTLRKLNIAVLFHMSTPCETYSIGCANHHRESKRTVPKTEMAKKHDAMNRSLAQWVCANVLPNC